MQLLLGQVNQTCSILWRQRWRRSSFFLAFKSKSEKILLLRKTTLKSLTVNSLGRRRQSREWRREQPPSRIRSSEWSRNQFRTTPNQNACVFLELGQQVRAEKYQRQSWPGRASTSPGQQQMIKETIAGVGQVEWKSTQSRLGMPSTNFGFDFFVHHPPNPKSLPSNWPIKP